MVTTRCLAEGGSAYVVVISLTVDFGFGDIFGGDRRSRHS